MDILPFLSVVTRTRGLRIRTLRDVLMCLCGQSCQDYELIIVVHNGDQAAFDAVHALVGEFPDGMRRRVSITACTRPGRAAPLNHGVDRAKGRYIAVLDDDDMVFGHWIETFRKLAGDSPGALVRARCSLQCFEISASGDLPPRPRATSWFTTPWSASYDALRHLHINDTPIMSVAFPIDVFHKDGLRFDEGLTTTEDWDLLTRAAMLRGVISTPEITSIYRWWTNGESSRFEHSSEEWQRNMARIRRNFDSRPLSLPPGSASQITSLFDANSALTARVSDLERERQVLRDENQRLQDRIGRLEDRNLQLEDRNLWMGAQLLHGGGLLPWLDDAKFNKISHQVLLDLVNSNSWRCTRPLRRLVSLLSGRAGSGLTADNLPLSPEDRQRAILDIRASLSWHVASPLRLIGQLLRRLAQL
jgi:glycosyltransferase involved in cell wall biosynthesis